MAGKGRRNENRLVNLVNRETPPYIDAVANGYSGSHATCQSDILVRTPTLDHAIETKNFGWSTGDRRTLGSEDDLEDLADSGNGYTWSWFVLDWSNRELIVAGPITATTVEGAGKQLVAALPDGCEPSLTDANNVRGKKADTDVLTSSQAGQSDIEVLAEQLNLDLASDVTTGAYSDD